VFGALAVWLLAACSSQLATNRGRDEKPAAQPAVTGIKVEGSGDTVQIQVSTNARPRYSLVQQANPPRLLLELVGTGLGAFDRTIPVNRGAVTVIRPAASGKNSSLEVFLSGEAAYTVESRGQDVVLNVGAPAPKAAAEAIGRPAADVEPAKPEQPKVTIAVDATVAAPAAPAAPATAAPTEKAAAPETATAPAPAAPPAAPAKAAAPVPSGPRFLMSLDVQKAADGSVVTLKGNGPLSYEYFLVDGKSLVVDIADAANKVWPMVRKVNDGFVTQVRIGEHAQPKKATRVVFDLKKLAEYKVSGEGDTITVAFGAAAAAAAAAAPKEGATTAVNTVTEVTYRPLDGRSRIEIRAAVKPDFALVDSGDPAKLVIEVANARIAPKDQKTLDLGSLNREVVRLTTVPFVKGDIPMVRVSAQLRQAAPVHAVVDGTRVVVDIERAAAPAAAPAAAAAPAPAAQAAAPAAAPAAPAAAAAAPVAAAPMAAAPTEETGAQTASAYHGRKLSLDFKDADVNDILRLISEVSGLNFVAGPEVKGSVTIKLADVPWDQALEIILKTNQPQLAQIRESDTIVRITTADKIVDEEQRKRRIEEDKKKTLDAQRALEPLFTKSYLISYAKAKEIGEIIQKSYSSERGKSLVQSDERTNTVIVQDTQGTIDEIDKVVQVLDTPTPAVVVEARIVEVQSNYGQQLGIQWNANFVADAAHGNATPYAFPNSVAINGTQASGAGASASNWMVNLPAAAATSGIGFTLGHVANTLTLDMRLSAMESMGRTKVLSNPKILVVQNQEATINLGSQLPIPKTDSLGNRTVEWKDVGITLKVKPQVTNDKRVFMVVHVEKSEQGQNVQTTEGTMFSINTSRADTNVLIADGETTVIGGMFIQSDIRNDQAVPGLGKIPIFGWLFKSKDETTLKRELMIFLTPRIVSL
jgi:type IV pilus assembly protein PilQ